MAVTKIRKISSWTLWGITIISAVILALFFFGGVGEPFGKDASKNPIFTGELLIWCYVLLAVCALSMLLFGISQFINKLISNPKSGLVTLGVFAGFALLLIIAYSLGDVTPIPSHLLNSDSWKFNVDFWLKVTDMWLYGMYILLVLTVCAMIWGSLRSLFKR